MLKTVLAALKSPKQLPTKMVVHLRDVTFGTLRNAAYAFIHRKDPRHYGIVPGYRYRASALSYDDTGNTDKWQYEVYRYAADLMGANGFQTVCDVGCGSGYKLVHQLGDFETTGTDIPQTVTFLRSKYPERRWLALDEVGRLGKFDLVICADVIEHVDDPDALLSLLESIAKRHILISTPDRNLCYRRGNFHHFGPSTNPTHLREWSFDEFVQFVAGRFNVLDHRISNRLQATQMLLCEVRRKHPMDT
jgi:Methyltransferase domain